MDSKIVFVALVLVAAFAIPTRATTLEKDFISAETVMDILKKTNANIMPSEDVINALTSKIVISNVVLEEALLKNVDHGVNGVGAYCGESCVLIPCLSAIIGCSCSNSDCFKNSLAM